MKKWKYKENKKTLEKRLIKQAIKKMKQETLQALKDGFIF